MWLAARQAFGLRDERLQRWRRLWRVNRLCRGAGALAPLAARGGLGGRLNGALWRHREQWLSRAAGDLNERNLAAHRIAPNDLHELNELGVGALRHRLKLGLDRREPGAGAIVHRGVNVKIRALEPNDAKLWHLHPLFQLRRRTAWRMRGIMVTPATGTLPPLARTNSMSFS